MAVSKASPAQLRRRGETYVTAPSSVVESVRNPDALAILIYLLDRPDDWVVRRAHLMERFSIGRDRYDKAMKELSNKGLAWRETIRDDSGRIVERRLCVSAEPRFPVGLSSEPEALRPDIRPEVEACGRKTHREGNPSGRENPPGGKSDHLHITESLTQNRAATQDKNKNGAHSERGSLIPEYDEVIDYGQLLGMSSEGIDRFFNFNEARGWLVSGEPIQDWQAMMNNWEERRKA